MKNEQIEASDKRKGLLPLMITILVILFLFKPIKVMNYRNVNKIIITNEAEKQQEPLILTHDDLIKFKELVGQYTILTMSPTGRYKLLSNLRIDFYKDNYKKYSMHLFSSSNGMEGSYIMLDYHVMGYDMPDNVIKALEDLLHTYDFSLETY